MRLRALLVAAVIGVAFPVVARATPCAAATPGVHHAGLVVQFGNGSSRQFCVEFADPQTTGLDLLRRAGLPVQYQDYGAGNVTVCKIAGEGCDYPKTPCFCRCTVTRDCTFWGYYSIDPGSGSWRFSNEGAGVHTVRDGEVDGWHWGKQDARGGDPPGQATLASVCARGEKVALTVATTPAKRSAPTALAAIAFAMILGALAFVAIRTSRRKDHA